MNIGKSIKLIRIQKDLKQIELAEKAKISVSYLSLLEQGKRDPNLSTLSNIAKALDVPLSIIVFLASDINNEIPEISQEIKEKLSYIAQKLIRESNSERSAINL